MEQILREWRKKEQAAKQPEKLTEQDLRDLMNTGKTLHYGKGGACK
ncbi:hypothetical protein [Domibacillus tundrae]|nr:hypothetical protein [Domibacillus tundrae]